jgi:23S rRNA (guanosine2251-2'-O)-methyltransferase
VNRSRGGGDRGRAGGGRPRGRDDVGGDQVEGRRAVRELLRAGRRRVKTVWLSGDAERDELLDEIAELAGPALRVASQERVNAAARTDAPQGVVAIAEPLAPADLDALLDDDHAFLVALDGVTDPRNLGAVMRVAETAGATGLLLPRHRSARITAALERASRAGVWSVAVDEHAEQTVDALSVADQRVIVVFGAEGHGLARLTRERCDIGVRIPMHGMLESLNVAAAAAVVCHAIAQRRNEAAAR